ncbi:guanine permease [Candidatus Fermentibacteria bacterium]|nr:MAG: guanine permease [Candidatus Fermentibacteria bacterium]
MLEKLFSLKEAGTTVRTEVTAGLAVFLTMSYIIFLQPAILSGAFSGTDTGMDYGSVLTATCIAAALATMIMALYARYPIAQAPGMGENFFFVFSVIPAAAGLAKVQSGQSEAWQIALGAVFISGVLFLLLSVLGVRKKLMDSISPSMKCGIAVGIGLFIALLGLQYAGLVSSVPGAALTMNTDFNSPDIWVFFFGLVLTVALMARKVPGAIFWGILGAAAFTLLLHGVLSRDSYSGARIFTAFHPAEKVVSAPPAVSPTFFRMDVAGALNLTMLPFIVVLLVMDVFDTMGTLVGVGTRAGFIKNNEMPRLERAMLSDAVGTVAGAVLGTSTVTSFIESTVGVEEGGRTGLTAVTVALLFLCALFFAPVFAMVGSYPPITAPALVVVGAMMLQNVRELKWNDPSETIPAFLVMAGIPFTCSIGDGLALGFIGYPAIKLASGKGKEAGWFSYLMAILLTVYFVLVRNAV